MVFERARPLAINRVRQADASLQLAASIRRLAANRYGAGGGGARAEDRYRCRPTDHCHVRIALNREYPINVLDQGVRRPGGAVQSRWSSVVVCDSQQSGFASVDHRPALPRRYKVHRSVTRIARTPRSPRPWQLQDRTQTSAGPVFQDDSPGCGAGHNAACTRLPSLLPAFPQASGSSGS